MGFLGDIIGAAVPIIGGIIGSKANKDAAGKAVKANKLAILAAQEAAARGVAAIREGAAGAEELLQPMIGGYRLNGLSASDQIGLDDMERQMTRRFAASGLRGAGAAGHAILEDQRRRFLAEASDRNLRRADAARSNLASIRANTGSAIGSTEVGAGSQIVPILQGQGYTQAALASDTGSMWGNVLGSVGAVLADAAKRRDQPGSYGGQEGYGGPR